MRLILGLCFMTAARRFKESLVDPANAWHPLCCTDIYSIRGEERTYVTWGGTVHQVEFACGARAAQMTGHLPRRMDPREESLYGLAEGTCPDSLILSGTKSGSRSMGRAQSR